MKKLYSTIMLSAMMIAALSLTACGGRTTTKTDSENNAISEEGYKQGYEKGFGFDESDIANYSEDDFKRFAKNSYWLTHQATSPAHDETPEEKELYDLYEEGYIKGIRSGIEAQSKTKDFFEKGHTYTASLYNEKSAASKPYRQYELKLRNDGTLELIETNYQGNTRTYECEMKKKSEMKDGIAKQWYGIYYQGRSQLYVDMEGNIYTHTLRTMGDASKKTFDIIGDKKYCEGTFTKTK